MLERSGKWHLEKPEESGVYLAQCYHTPYDVLDVAWLTYDKIKDSWLTEFGDLVECISWMPIPFPHISSRVPGLC